MKKKLGKFMATVAAGIMFMAMSVSAATPVKIDANTFPDSYLRELVQQYDLNKDGMLQEEEIAKVKKITSYKFPTKDELVYDENSKSSKAINYYTKKDLKFNCKGLEQFTNLEKLTLNMQNLYYKDVKMINFEKVYGIKILKNLEIWNAGITKLDVSKLKNIQRLDINSESVKNINFKGNKELKTLIVRNTKSLKSMNIEALPALNKVELEIVPIKNIKFGKKNATIKKLRIEDSILKKHKNKYYTKSVDISELKNLKQLMLDGLNVEKIALSKNKKLKELYVDECRNLQTLDTSKNKSLKILMVEDCNKLKTIDVHNNKNLKEIRCDGKYTDKIVLAKGNKVETIIWHNSKLKDFNVVNVNPIAIKEIFVNGTKIKKINVKKYKKLNYLSVNKKTKVIKSKKQKIEISKI